MNDKINDRILILSIQEIRKKNNVLWMDLLRIAMEADPAQAKKVLKEITANDQKVSELTAKLAE